MSKYQELKEHIEALDSGWTKEADDIFFKIGVANIVHFEQDTTSGCGSIKVNKRGYEKELGHGYFSYQSQCSKLAAFKSALLWLLDHSDIKKDEKQEKIEELSKKITDLTVELHTLRDK